jgi:TRAP-type C4-dicarboxylate transport system permease small subunit
MTNEQESKDWKKRISNPKKENQQPQERSILRIIIVIVFSVLGIGLMVIGLYYWSQEFSSGTSGKSLWEWLFPPVGTTLFVIGFIIFLIDLSIATKGKCFCCCADSTC